jgi:low affinity Fe/Cu permease
MPAQQKERTMGRWFAHFASRAAGFAGHYLTFLAAVALIVVWAITGPFFGFSETWQLVINTGTTIVTFLMVFLIQNTQNRDSQAVQLKLDELIRSIEAADNELMDAEDRTVEDLQALKKEYAALSRKHEALNREHATLKSQFGTENDAA